MTTLEIILSIFAWWSIGFILTTIFIIVERDWNLFEDTIIAIYLVSCLGIIIGILILIEIHQTRLKKKLHNLENLIRCEHYYQAILSDYARFKVDNKSMLRRIRWILKHKDEYLLTDKED